MIKDYSEQKKDPKTKESSQLSGIRILLYSVSCVICNILLGWFLIYVIQQNTSIRWITLASRPHKLILEVILRGIFLISPLFLSYIVNNALLHLFFVKTRYLKGIGLYALLQILLTQISLIYILFAIRTKNAPMQETVTAVMWNVTEEQMHGGTKCLRIF